MLHGALMRYNGDDIHPYIDPYRRKRTGECVMLEFIINMTYCQAYQIIAYFLLALLILISGHFAFENGKRKRKSKQSQKTQ